MKDLGVNLQNMGWYIAGTYTMGVIGKVITGYLADVVGRRITWVATGMLTALYLPLLTIAATPGNVAYMLLLFGFLYGAPYAINSTYMSESFPDPSEGNGGGRGVQHRPHRFDAVATSHRHRRRDVLDRSGHRPAWDLVRRCAWCLVFSSKRRCSIREPLRKRER